MPVILNQNPALFHATRRFYMTPHVGLPQGGSGGGGGGGSAPSLDFSKAANSMYFFLLFVW